MPFQKPKFCAIRVGTLVLATILGTLISRGECFASDAKEKLCPLAFNAFQSGKNIPVFESNIHPSTSFIKGHVVVGNNIFPATGSLELLLSSARMYRGTEDNVHLGGVIILSRVDLKADQVTKFTTVLGHKDRKSQTYVGNIFAESESGPDSWRSDRPIAIANTISFSKGDLFERSEDAASWNEALLNGNQMDYEPFKKIGLSYGPSFQLLTSTVLYHQENKAIALGKIKVPSSTEGTDQASLIIHPAVLDSAFHILPVLINDLRAPDGYDQSLAYIPFSFGELAMSGKFKLSETEELIVIASIESSSEAAIRSPGGLPSLIAYNLMIFQKDGTPVLTIKQGQLVRVPNEKPVTK